MNEQLLFQTLLLATFGLAGVVFAATGRMTAPYGRYVREGWGPSIGNRMAWVVMESPAVLAFAWFFFRGPRAEQLLPLLFFAMWQAHYVHRTLIYPFRLRHRPDKRMPLSIVAMGFSFNLLNAYLNGSSLSTFGPQYDLTWLLDIRFLYGTLLFVSGYAVNRWSDWALRRLRKPGEQGYAIPHGGLYEYVSCPNYFGEIVMWTGWAIATWSGAGLCFAVFSFANLAPRAVSHHRWYKRTFPDYPRRRKAVIPFLM